MKFGDLASIIQLGVAVHIGTALLQQYGDLGFAPLERKLLRIRSLVVPPETGQSQTELEEELDQLEGRYELFKIDFFKQFQWCVAANSVVAVLLAVALVFVAVGADAVVLDGWDYFWTTFAIGMSLLPAPLILAGLWFDARRRLEPLLVQAESIEVRALKGAAGTVT